METNKIRITPKWEKSKDQIWVDCFDALNDIAEEKIIPFYRQKIFGYAVAAVLSILLVLPFSAFFYTKQINTACGEHLSVVLPDGSKVEMNAESMLKYKPFWWTFSRDVELLGEAYFEVEKGSRFAVRSNEYLVSVLGTSFNVFAREHDYRVNCLTGKVSVSDEQQSVILTPGTQVNYKNGVLLKSENSYSQHSIGWTTGQFSFVSTPLNDVIDEVERQYNIEVEKPESAEYLYTGTFTKKDDPQKVLEIIGKPFGIKLKMIEN